MDTTFSTAASIRTEQSMSKLQDKFKKQISLIHSKPVDESVLGAILAGFKHFLRLMNNHYNDMVEIILEWMNTVVYVRNRCDTPELIKLFEDKIPHLTSFCIMIAEHPNVVPPFKQRFFVLWAKIISGISVEIRKTTVQNDVSAMAALCETILTTGHFLTQMNGLALFLKYIGTCGGDLNAILKEIVPSDNYKKVREMLYNFDYNHFDIESRNFLNELNMKIIDETVVHSIVIQSGFIENTPIIKPVDRGVTLDLWVDFNTQTGSVSFFCDSSTFPEGSASRWVNVEIFPKKISVDKKKNEFRIYSTKKVSVEPPKSYKIFSRRKLTLRFICDQNNLESLMPIHDRNTDIFNATGSTSIDSTHCSGHETITADHENILSTQSHHFGLDRIYDAQSEKNSVKTKEDKNNSSHRKVVQTTNSTPQKLRLQTSTPFQMCSPDISSIHSNCENNNFTKNVKIAPTFDNHNKVEREANKQNNLRKNSISVAEISANKLKTQSSREARDDKNGGELPKDENITKVERRVTRRVAAKAANKENLGISISEPLRDLTNTLNLKRKKQFKPGKIPAIKKLLSKNISDTIVENNTATQNEKNGKNNNEKELDKEEKYHKNSKEISANNTMSVITLDTVNENNLRTQPTTQKLVPCEITKISITASSPKTVNKNQQTVLSYESGVKRKLFNPNEENIHPISQESKDTQIRRRNYLQERRKRESKGSLKLVNLVKPLELTDKSGEVNTNRFGNKSNLQITGGNEEEIQNTIEEYVNNRGYVGIKNALNDENRAPHLSIEQRQIVSNNLEKINSIFERTTNKFFRKINDIYPRKTDIYDVRNAVADDPKPVNKGRKAKKSSTMKKHQVPKFIGENRTATYSYRRNKNTRLGYMEKEIIVDMSDSDVTKQSTVKQKPIDSPKRKSVKSSKQIQKKKTSVVPARQSLPRAKKPTKFKIDDSEHSDDDSVVEENNVNHKKEVDKTKEVLDQNNLNNIRKEVSKSTENVDICEVITQPFIGAQEIHSTYTVGQIHSRKSGQQHEVTAIIHNTRTSAICGRSGDILENSIEIQDEITNQEDVPETVIDESGSKISATNEWILNRYFQSLEMEPMKEGTSIIQNEEDNRSINHINAPEEKRDSVSFKSSDHATKFDDDCSQYGDDNIDLDSYNSDQSTKSSSHHDYRKSEMGTNIINGFAQSESTESEDIQLTFSINNDNSLINREIQKEENAVKTNSKKRKNLNIVHRNQIVVYKRIRRESIEVESTNPEVILLFNFKRDMENIYKNIWNEIQVTSSFSDISALTINLMQNFYKPYEHHIRRAKESLKKIEDLRAQMKMEENNFTTETHSAIKQLKKFCLAANEVNNTFNTVNTTYDSALNTFAKEATVAMKQHWKEYIDKVTQICVETIKRRKSLDIE